MKDWRKHLIGLRDIFMIRNKEILEKFEIEIEKKEKVDFFKNLKIFEALYKEAVEMKILPLKNPLEEIEVDIKLAHLLNSLK